MGLQFDMADETTTTPGSGGAIPEAGRYHVAISKVDEWGGNDSMLVEYEILAGSTPEQEGKTFRDYFNHGAKSAWRQLLLACSVGLTSQEEIEDAKERKDTGFSIDFERAVGRQLFVGIEPEEYNGKSRLKTNGRLYHVNDERVQDAKNWPRHAEELTEFRTAFEIPAPEAAGEKPNEPVDVFANV